MSSTSALARRALALACTVVFLAGGAEAARGRRPQRPPARPDRALFEDASAALAKLRQSPGRQGRRGEWSAVVLKFRRVVDRYPKSSWCDDALLNVGNLYREMAERFKSKRDRDEAVRAYQWVVREYPASRLGEQALFASYEIAQQSGEKARLTDAIKAYLDAYPRGPHASDLRESLKKRAPERAAAIPAPPPIGVAEVFDMREWGGDTSARVVLDMEKTVPLSHGRIADQPNRLVVSMEDARLHPNLVAREGKASGILVGARLVEKSRKSVDLILDFGSLSTYSVFYLQDPLRLVIDAQWTPPAPAVTVRETPTAPDPAEARPPQGIDSAVERATTSDGEPPAAGEETVVTSESQHASIRRPSVSLSAPAPTPQPEPSPSPSPSPPPTAAVESHPRATTSAGSPEAPPSAAADEEARTRVARASLPKPGPRPPVTATPSTPPRTNRGGSYSLARQLGLKAQRILIDAGHGGHDPGTIGPGGLQEKDLVLDVALRLERRLRDELGVEVLMTRDQDVFIPLEERTAIANAKGVDLFLSIHANSSRSPKARGIETYYLNFAATPHAESVAARENAISAATMKDLESLVKSIMRNSKIPESRDFAAAVQESLVSKVRAVNPKTEDRGVHTAPFYVLIGATMPSVLAEIAFVSHPEEEELLRTSEYRDTIADSLLGGVRNYLETLPAGPVRTGSARGTSPPARARR